MRDIQLWQCEFTSRRLKNRRTIWLQPASDRANHACIFLDAEYYLAHLRAASIVAELQDRAAIPAVNVAYVSSIDQDARWPESFCNDEFAAFLHEEFLPWLRDRSGADGSGITLLAGLSLTGLSAAHAALRHPDSFPRVLCQSGSFWWNDNWLANHLPATGAAPPNFRISVGSKETQEEVDHGNGLFQRDSQLESNRQFRDALLAAGHRVSYEEYPGGHDISSWRSDLPKSLATLLRS